MNKRLLSVLLSLLLILSLIPLEAFAVDSGGSTAVNVKLHGKNIKDYEDNKGDLDKEDVAAVWNSDGDGDRESKMSTFYDTVYLGGKAYYVLSMNGSSDDYNYNETKNLDGIHTIATYTDDGGSEVDSQNAMFLLSDEPLGSSQFYTETDENHYWSKHTDGSLWDKLNGNAKDSTLVSKMNLSNVEYAAILNTTKADVRVVTKLTDGFSSNWYGDFNQTWHDSDTSPNTTHFSSDLLGDKLYPLSVSEVLNSKYGLNTKQARLIYESNVSNGSYWWLRSSAQSLPYYSEGIIMRGEFNYWRPDNSNDVRPALNLNQNCILFASDAADNSGKMNADLVGTFTNALATTDTNQWKLTLTDSNLKLNDATLIKNANEYCVAYSDASNGENTYISAIVVDKTDDKNEVLYYGKLKALTDAADSSGVTASFQIPDGVELGKDIEMQVFVEKVSGSPTGTDYASAVKEFNSAETVESITVTGAKTDYIAGDTFVEEGVTVTAHLSGGGKLELNNWTFDYPNYSVSSKNDGEFHINTKERETQTVKINSGYVNAEGKPVTYNLSVNVEGIGKDDKPELTLSENEDGTYKISISVSDLLDGVATEYSTDGGRTWRNVGTKLDSIDSKLNEVTYQVRIKADIANDRAAGTVASVTLPAREATIYDVVFSAAVLSAVTTGIFAIEANRLIAKGFVVNNSILGNRVSSWIKMMYKLSGLKLGS